MNTRINHWLARVFILVALAAGAVGAQAGVAHAATQQRSLAPGQGYNFNTYFWGRTEVCVQNVDPGNDGADYWVSSTSYGSDGFIPGQTKCLVRSFAGFQIYVKNTSSRATLKVTFPIGP